MDFRERLTQLLDEARLAGVSEFDVRNVLALGRSRYLVSSVYPVDLTVSEIGTGPYVLMPETQTYALGVQALRDSYKRGECPSQPTVVIKGVEVVRPFTFKEVLEARVEDYETLRDAQGNERTEEQRLQLWRRWNDSCTAIMYQGGTSRFKIVPVSEHLVGIRSDFNEYFIADFDYDSYDVPELDSAQLGVVYNNWLLTREQVLDHPAWRAAVGNTADGRKLLEAYSELAFHLFPRERNNRGSGFYVRQLPRSDELRALCVSSRGSSSANGYYNLNYNGSFVRVC